MRIPPGRLTNGLAIATAAAWLFVMLAGLQQAAIIFGGFFPVRLSGATLQGALPAFLTPLSAALLHDGLAHLAFNVVTLIYCGRYVENVVGAAPLAVLYVVGAYAAAFAQFLADPMSATPMIGASGAISAVVGAYAMLYGQRTARAIGPVPGRVVHIVWLAAAWIVVQLLFGLALASGGVQLAVAAHIGGFLAGLALARPLLKWRFRHA